MAQPFARSIQMAICAEGKDDYIEVKAFLHTRRDAEDLINKLTAAMAMLPETAEPQKKPSGVEYAERRQ
jgi:hypothetical protein